MWANNLKGLIIHILISVSAFYYTANVHFEQSRFPTSTSDNIHPFSKRIYIIILISSLILYYLIGRMFLEDQYTSSKNMLSISIVPIIGMVIWAILFRRYQHTTVFQINDWSPYLVYIGYTTPVIYKYIYSQHILPLFSWIPAIILFLSIKVRS